MRPLDDEYWEEIMKSPAKAKEALCQLAFPNGSRVTQVTMESGLEVPVEDVTEKQAYEFMMGICPARLLSAQ